jgi:hypothetical protein
MTKEELEQEIKSGATVKSIAEMISIEDILDNKS